MLSKITWWVERNNSSNNINNDIITDGPSMACIRIIIQPLEHHILLNKPFTTTAETEMCDKTSPKHQWHYRL